VLNKWNQKVIEINNKYEKKKLTLDEEKKLIESIRFSHLSHSDLISLSIDPIMSQYKDLILLGLSFRLNAYENANKIENSVKNINYNPRKYLKDQKTYLGNSANPNKIQNSNYQANKSYLNSQLYNQNQSSHVQNLK